VIFHPIIFIGIGNNRSKERVICCDLGGKNLKRKMILPILFVSMIALAGGCSKRKGNSDASSLDTTINQDGYEAGASIPSDTDKNKELQTNTDTEDQAALFPAYQLINGVRRYGFIDAAGTFVIEPAFTSAKDFSDDRAVVRDTEQTLVIDTEGNTVFRSAFDIEPFQNGAAIISQIVEDKYLKGFINTEGDIIIPPIYEKADGFNEDGSALVSPERGIYERIDKSGKVQESCKLEEKYSNVIEFRDGYIVYSDFNSMNIGVVDYKGKQIIKPNYSGIKYLGDDLFAVYALTDESFVPEYARPAALFNCSGEQLTGFRYYDISEFNEGFASVTDNKYTYFINEKGEAVKELPKFAGRGTLKFVGNDIIKAEIDRDLIYQQKDNAILWQNDRTQILASNLQVKANKVKLNKYVTVYYPVIEGLDAGVQKRVNAKLHDLFTQGRLDTEEEDYLSAEDDFAAKLQKNLIIIRKTGYDYYFGAAHGMPIRQYYYIDRTTGNFYELSDLFRKDSDYESRINSILSDQIEEELEKDDTMFFTDSFQGIREDQDFILTGDSIILYFTPMEIAAYAEGFPEFTIPFEKIKDIIDTDGAFWNAFKK